MSARAISTEPLLAAQSSGVDPSPDRMLTSAPDLRSARTACTSLALTALVRGLSPLAPVTAKNTPPHSSTPPNTSRTRHPPLSLIYF